MQFTIRGITEDLDRAARERAEREGLSLNEALVRALRSGLELEVEKLPAKKRDLSGIFGQHLIDEQICRVLEEQRVIESEHWD